VAVAFDAFSSVAEGTGNLSWTHTPVGTPRAVRVDIVENGGTNGVSSVTYGGVAMELVAANAKTSGEAGTVVTYFLGKNIPTGAQTVSVTVSDAVAKRAGAITLTASGNTCWTAADVSVGSDSLANPSSTLNLLGKTAFVSLALHSGMNAVTGITQTTGWTSRLEHDFGNQTAAWYTYNTISTANVACGWTQTADDAVMVALAITEAPLAPDTATVQLTEAASIVVVFDARALPIIITEAVNVVVVLAASDSVSVSLTETLAATVAGSTSDGVAVQLTEVGAALFTSTFSVSVTDSLAVQADDASQAIQATALISDSIGVVLSDARAVVLTETGALVVEGRDTLTVQAVEEIDDLFVFNPGDTQNYFVTDSLTVQLNGGASPPIEKSATDSFLVGIEEPTDQATDFGVIDTAAVQDAESVAIVEDLFLLKTASDSATAGLSETSTLSANTILIVSDSLAVLSPEDTPQVATVIAGSDDLPIGCTDIGSPSITISLTDTAVVQVSGTVSQITALAELDVTDSAAVQADEVTSLGAIATQASDSVAAVASELLTNGSTVYATDDTISGVLDISAIFKDITIADSAAVQVSEFVAPIFSDFQDVSASDSCAVQVSETTGLIDFIALITAVDAPVVQAEDIVSTQSVTAGATDSLTAGFSDPTSLLVVLSVSDTLKAGTTEAGLAIPIVPVGVTVFADDTILGFNDAAGLGDRNFFPDDTATAGATEDVTVSSSLPPAETVAALLLESLRLDLSGALSETHSCGLIESVSVSVVQDISDSSAVACNEDSMMQPGYYVDDSCSILCEDDAADEAVANETPETWNGNTNVEHKQEFAHPGRYRLTNSWEW
jgi:hypothetical protein